MARLLSTFACALAFAGPSAPSSGSETATAAAAGAEATGSSSRKIAALHPRHAPSAQLVHVHTGKSLRLQLFDSQGRIQRAELERARSYLACHKTGTDHPIHWRLLTLIQAVAAHYPKRAIRVFSGYRDPSVSHNAHRSNHTRGRAIDIRVEGIANRVLFDSLRGSFRNVGIGYYPNSRFVHLDIRRGNAIWVDYAGPGQTACYSPTPKADLRNGAAERFDYAQARKRGCRR